MQPAVAAIGFDLGETLVTYADTPLDWSSLYERALVHVAATVGASLGTDEIAWGVAVLRRYNTRLIPRRHEVSAEQIFEEIRAAWPAGVTAALPLPVLIQAFFGFFQQRLVTYPETRAVLTALRERGFALGLLTDVPYGMPREFVQRDLDAAGIRDFFQAWLTSVDVGWRKPAPAGFLALAGALQVMPDRLCFVGNEEKDIRGALAAGAMAVLVDREGRCPDWGQHARIRDLRELPALAT